MQSQTWSEAAPWCRFSIALQQVTANEEDTLWVKLDDCNIHDSKAKRVRVLLCSPCTPRLATTGSTLVRSDACAMRVQLAEALEKNQHLTSLDLSSNHLQSSAVQVGWLAGWTCL